MNEKFRLGPDSRMLVLLPHPDDESLATGGLLQMAMEAGGKCRVIYLTDGENNPWPQRAIECRWKIKAADKERWGMRRRLEAIRALSELCISESSAVFWGYSDQGLTSLLIEASDEIPKRLIREFRDWQPSIFVTPAPSDLHPDHSASAIFARLALAHLGANVKRPMHIEYRVHDRGPKRTYGYLTLALSKEEQKRKRSAILCHTSQLRLRRNLTEFAMPTEEFINPAEINDLRNHPVRNVSLTGEEIELELALSFHLGACGRPCLYIASESRMHPGNRLSITLPRHGTALVDVRDTVHDKVITQARFSGNRNHLRLCIPLTALGSADSIYVKLERRFGFFDEAGWCELSFHFA